MKVLSGGAVDTLYALFWFGPRLPGEIPSKSGEIELEEMGFCRRVFLANVPKVKTKDDILFAPGSGYHQDNSLMTVLTPSGYENAYFRFTFK
ncbi:hypothetical protein DEEACLCL_00018 [Salmonella phage CRW-SP2]|nr:hypothetical protein DEEACLCL_00018 [Salmonella phage CRW-SP2]